MTSPRSLTHIFSTAHGSLWMTRSSSCRCFTFTAFVFSMFPSIGMVQGLRQLSGDELEFTLAFDGSNVGHPAHTLFQLQQGVGTADTFLRVAFV